ncbi:MAG: peptidoglycan-binding protein [Acidimicrobiales bacterium]
MNRRALLAGVAGVSILSAGIGWFFGQSIKSPAEIAAQTAAPDPSLITVPVELRELASRVVVRGTVTSSEVTTISVSPSTDGSSIITRLPKAAGDTLNEGDVVAEVAGRPVIVLQGDLPVFRSLGPSMEGPDVTQLEQSLVRLGYDVGTVDGVYDAALADAVNALYRDAGYRANEPTTEETDALARARTRVRDAQNAINDLATTPSSLSESERLRLTQAINQQQAALDAAATERASVLAEPAAEAAAAKAAVDALASDATPEERQAADQRLADANYVLWVLTAEQNKLVEAAQLELDIAYATRNEAINPPATSNNSALASARDELAAAKADLERTLSTTGVSFPTSELVFVPTLPREVQSVSTEVGSSPQGPIITTTGSSTVIESSVSATDRRLLKEGLEVLVEDDGLGISQKATISFLADSPGTGTATESKYEMNLTPIEPLPEEAFNQSLRVTIPISTTGGEVLAVPLAAVSAAANGGARVEVDRGDGTTELVDVSTGLAADGYVEVTPLSGSLSKGDRVVVGRDLGQPASAGDTTESTDPEAEGG